MQPVNINGVIQLPITRVLDGNPETQNDWLAVEEPLEIRLEWTEEEKRRAMSVAVTMRTPGDDEELAAGFLLTEAIINDAHHISSIKACGPVQKAKGHQNIIRVTLSDGCAVDPKKLSRHVFTTSSCGICGKASIDAIRSSNPFSEALQQQGGIPTFNLSAEQLCRLPQQLSDDQRLFQQTGGIHAAALVDETGAFIYVREDVGRHNAVDKLLGRCFLDHRLPLKDTTLMLSGRASFELLQKAAMAGISRVVAVGAPSSLAVELARECGIALAGFLKQRRLNVYHGQLVR